MSGEDGQMSGPPPARRARRRRLGLVWIAPGAAVLIVGWIGLKALLTPSLKVEVLFDTAAGVIPGQTRVSYHGLDEGVVKGVALARDGRRIAMTLSMKPDARPLLVEGTRFWIVGAKPSLTDPQSLKSVFAGSSLELAPGSGAPARRFVGADQPPPIAPGVAGRRFRLAGGDLGNLHPDASVFFHGLEVGKVTATGWSGGEAPMWADVFVRAPYDAAVRRDSRFWLYSPLHISSQLEGLAGQFGSPLSLFVGAVSFDRPQGAPDSPQAGDGESFPLASAAEGAATAPSGPQARYALELGGAVGRLEKGAPVLLRGFVVGSVGAVSLATDGGTGALSTRVEVALEPWRMHLRDGGSGDAQARVDRVIAALVARGLVGRIGQDPPVLGARVLDLEIDEGRRQGPTRLVRDASGMAMIPGASTPDPSAMLRDAGEVLQTVKATPIRAVAANALALTGRLRTLAASPELDTSLDHLDDSLRRVDSILAEAQPQVEPLTASLRQASDRISAAAGAANALLGGEGAGQDGDLPSTLRQLNDTARALRTLADDLDRRPEALFTGKR